MRAYLAGPEVFLPDAAAVGARKVALCRAHGITGLFPGDAGETDDAAIFAANVRLMRGADFGIFNLTPFRGPSADVGTVWELGFMAGMGKPVFGYTHDARPLHDRVAGAVREAGGTWRDGQGLLVEGWGNADNLMIDRSLAPHGPVRLDRGGRLDAPDGLDACLRLAARRLLGS